MQGIVEKPKLSYLFITWKQAPAGCIEHRSHVLNTAAVQKVMSLTSVVVLV
jgi:hypothetical protein